MVAVAVVVLFFVLFLFLLLVVAAVVLVVVVVDHRRGHTEGCVRQASRLFPPSITCRIRHATCAQVCACACLLRFVLWLGGGDIGRRPGACGGFGAV